MDAGLLWKIREQDKAAPPSAQYQYSQPDFLKHFNLQWIQGYLQPGFLEQQNLSFIYIPGYPNICFLNILILYTATH